jgi:hypothetical protein
MRLAVPAAFSALLTFASLSCGRQELDDSTVAGSSGAAGTTGAAAVGGAAGHPAGAAGTDAGVAGSAAGAGGGAGGAGGAGTGGAAGNPGPPDPVVLPECQALAAAGSPDSLRQFNWDVAAPGCSGSPVCFTTVVIDDCSVYIQGTAGNPAPGQIFDLSAQDCRAARSWVSSSWFVEVLRTGSGCTPTARGEAWVVGLSPNYVFTSTNFCPEPTVQSVRTCLGGLLTRLTHTPWP